MQSIAMGELSSYTSYLSGYVVGIFFPETLHRNAIMRGKKHSHVNAAEEISKLYLN